MKKYWMILLALLLCLLAACTQDEPTAGTTAATTAPTAASTAAPTETTEATEPPSTVWLPQEEPALSYEEYFSQDRVYRNRYAYQWFVPSDDGDEYYGYELQNIFEGGLGIFGYYDSGSAYHIVPDSEAFSELKIVGVYGKWAYCTNLELDAYLSDYDSDYHATQLVKLDMLTGEWEYIVQDTVITNAYICDQVLYYAQYLDGEMQIVRQYLPTGDRQIFPTGEETVALFSLYIPKSTNGPLEWSVIDPQLREHLENALSDPNSEYKHMEYENNEFLWQVDSVLTSPVRTPLQRLCSAIQYDTGTDGVRRVTYDLQTGERKEEPGVICQCSLVGILHYHFDLEETPMPVPSVGQWLPLLGEKPEASEQTLSVNDYTTFSHILYRESGSGYIKICDVPVSDFRVSGAYIYALTCDNALVRMKEDGTEQVVLYSGTAVHDMGPHRESTMLYIADGDQLLQLDLENHQYRVILKGISPEYIWINLEEENVLLLEMKVGYQGSCYQQYLYNFVTGEIKETFRL